jgi:hypothetical protein
LADFAGHRYTTIVSFFQLYEFGGGPLQCGFACGSRVLGNFVVSFFTLASARNETTGRAQHRALSRTLLASNARPHKSCQLYELGGQRHNSSFAYGSTVLVITLVLLCERKNEQQKEWNVLLPSTSPLLRASPQHTKTT